MAELVLCEPFESLWRNQNAFEAVQHIAGQVVRSKEGRTTKRCLIGDTVFYVKCHTGIGWYEIIKNWLQLKAPVTGARNEWLAINKLHAIGLNTLELVAYGEQDGLPTDYVSFIATRELTDVISLAKYTERWRQQPPTFAHKFMLVKQVALIAKTLHDNGINHRDLYICHFLLSLANVGIEDAMPDIYVVDLHRAQIRTRVPRRWLVKDIASIYFSAMDIGLTQRDVYRFLIHYLGCPLRVALTGHVCFLSQVKLRANKLYWRDHKCSAPEIV